jgi:YjbE family integral membrane protein
MPEITPDLMFAFLQIIAVDLVLAGDNAIVVGMVAASLPREQRTRVIIIGIVAATVLRIAFALVTVQLLQVIGLLLAGGILLLWVCWKLWREIRAAAAEGSEDGETREKKSFGQAVFQIILADVSMSLDNVLAVAGIAREHPAFLLIFGLVLSIALMAFAANLIANLLQKYRWIAYVGLLSILYVAGVMVWEGSHEIINVAMVSE